jgi:putative heme-binding domain-containing protein
MIESHAFRSAPPHSGRQLLVFLLSGLMSVPLVEIPRPASCQESTFRPEVVVGLLELILEADPEAARGILRTLREKVQSRELREARLEQLRPKLEQLLEPIRQQGNAHALYADAVLLAASWGEKQGQGELSTLVESDEIASALRAEALRIWVDSGDAAALDRASAFLVDSEIPREFQEHILQALGQARQDRVATVLLTSYARVDATQRPLIVELLTRRAAWSKQLLAEIKSGRLPPTVLHANQVARLQSSPDVELVELSREVWGTVRTQRNPQRQRVIDEVRQRLSDASADPVRGREVFRKVCANCHKIHGEGHDVGPDITRNGRSTLEQLLSNVLDPSLVIGASYQGRIIATEEGQVLTGLVVEENDRRIVLKLPGGQLESIPREEIEQMRISELSLMPEGLEEQLEPQELVDLFAFLRLDKPPEDPTAQRIPLE